MPHSTETESKPLRIAVVGGGIAGLACAVGIANKQSAGANVELKIYEQAQKFGEIGAGVSFGPNAERALRLMGAGGALDKAAGARDSEPQVWFDFMVGDAAHEKAKEYICTVASSEKVQGSINVHRADFLDQLISILPPNVASFNKKCLSYTPHPDGITLNFADGTSGETDVIIASDGIKSNLRKALFEKKGLSLESQQAVYSEWVAWRGMIPVEHFEKAMGKDAKKKMMHCGQDCHILHFPVRNGQLVNIVGFVRDPEHKKLNGRTGPWAAEAPQSEMLEDYKNFTEETKALLKAIEKPSVWGIFAGQPIEEITDDRMVLIGDAAHAMTPHQGAGAGQAIEDALFISEIMSHPSVTNAPLAQRGSAINHALKVYKEARHPRGLQVQRTSREAGLLYEFLGVKGEGSDVTKMKTSLEERMNWIWEFDEEEELKKVLALL